MTASAALQGVSRRRSLALLLAGRSHPEAQMLEMMERKNHYYQELLKQITPDNLLPGGHTLLEAVRAAGLKIAIGSASKNAREVVQRLHIMPYIDDLADGYSVVRPKPAGHPAGQQQVRVWMDDIELHISSDIAYTVWQYWRMTGDDTFMVRYGAEMILDTTVFWGQRF